MVYKDLQEVGMDIMDIAGIVIVIELFGIILALQAGFLGIIRELKCIAKKLGGSKP